MDLGLPEEHSVLIEQLGLLARKNFAPRAVGYDKAAAFPRESFEDLHTSGYLAALVPKKYGGLGLGPLHGSTLTLWMMTREIARADLSLARCWEGHSNSMTLLDSVADGAQKERFFQGVVERGEIWVVWSGEPQARKPGTQSPVGTTVREVEGGFVLDGAKVFATSSTGARRAILLVHRAGPGGARHSTAGVEGLLMLVCDMDDPSIEVDDTWWDAIGMRATVSHRVCFKSTFLPAASQLGRPGQYLSDGWQTRFTPHYTASFLGAAQAAFDYTLDYITTQKKGDDPYVQHRVGRMSMNIETSYLWLRHVAELWDSGREIEAQVAGSRARHLVEHLTEETIHHAIRICGARSLVRPSPLERILRDLTLYLRHDNDDQVLATLGREVLGTANDLSFFKA